MRRKPSVLFMCVHNAGRSQIAAAYMRELAGDAVDVRSAGSSPGKRINPVAAEVMAEEGIDITAASPQFASAELMQTADIVITMGCGDECVYYPGRRYLDWELDDPAGRPIDEVRVIRDHIKRYVLALISELVD